jgi:hypothetical protein
MTASKGKKYTVTSPVRYEGELYPVGAEIVIDEAHLEPVLHCVRPAPAKAAKPVAGKDTGEA